MPRWKNREGSWSALRLKCELFPFKAALVVFFHGCVITLPATVGADSCNFFQTTHIFFLCFWKTSSVKICTCLFLPLPLKKVQPLTGNAQQVKSGHDHLISHPWQGQDSTRTEQQVRKYIRSYSQQTNSDLAMITPPWLTWLTVARFKR